MSVEKCFICKLKDGTETIIDATQYPETYNGKPICESCSNDRKILRDTK